MKVTVTADSFGLYAALFGNRKKKQNGGKQLIYETMSCVSFPLDQTTRGAAPCINLP